MLQKTLPSILDRKSTSHSTVQHTPHMVTHYMKQNVAPIAHLALSTKSMNRAIHFCYNLSRSQLGSSKAVIRLNHIRAVLSCSARLAVSGASAVKNFTVFGVPNVKNRKGTKKQRDSVNSL